MPKRYLLVTPRRFNDSLGELVEIADAMRELYAEAYDIAHSRRPAYDDQTIRAGKGDPTGSSAAALEDSRNLLRSAGQHLEEAKRALRSAAGAVRKSVKILDAPGGYNPEKPQLITKEELAEARRMKARRDVRSG